MCGQTFRYVRSENQIPQLRDGLGTVRYANTALQKGRPPPGGEEAEVVVYQPRGVGLMHTRHKPSDFHYTHGGRAGRKTACQRKHLLAGKITVTGTCRELPFCTLCRQLSRAGPYAGRCDRIRSG